MCDIARVAEYCCNWSPAVLCVAGRPGGWRGGGRGSQWSGGRQHSNGFQRNSHNGFRKKSFHNSWFLFHSSSCSNLFMWSESPQYHVFMHVKLYTKVVDYIHGCTITQEYEKASSTSAFVVRSSEEEMYDLVNTSWQVFQQLLYKWGPFQEA